MSPYKFTLPQKFTDNQLDSFVDEFYQYFSQFGNKGIYYFDFSSVEWISNQELVVLTAILKYLVAAEAPFKVNFLKDGGTANIDRRVANQIFQICTVWKIFQIVPQEDYEKYFDIDIKVVYRLEQQFKLKAPNSEIYDRYGITPFITLNNIAQYDDRIIGDMLENTYKLSRATNDVLRVHDCRMPLENHTLSSIITKELFENFLDHSVSNFFGANESFAFMSLSLSPKLRTDDDKTENVRQRILEKNFREESNQLLKNFFYDGKKNVYKNQSYLQFSFLDFGQGIAKTLMPSFLEANNIQLSAYEPLKMDALVLRYAFEYSSSKDPIDKRYLQKTVIPRGLYDLLTIVRRFNGLMIVRSGHGKIFFDFSGDKNSLPAGQSFGNADKYFPGSLITIYLPERKPEDKFDITKITVPHISQFKKKVPLRPNYINLYQILRQAESASRIKSEIYSKVFDSVASKISYHSDQKVIYYFDFDGFEIDERITRKIVHFLISDYNVNYDNNIVVINPPPLYFLEQLNNEIFQLNIDVASYRLHPIPFVSLVNNQMEVFWMGVFDQTDVDKLSELLLDQHDLRRDDFQNPHTVVGNLNFYDEYGNLHSYFQKDDIIRCFKEIAKQTREDTCKKIILQYLKVKSDSFFLCPGNYYQREYLQLFDSINNSTECRYLAKCLQSAIQESAQTASYKFMCVTASSLQILNNFTLPKEERDQTIYLDNYLSVHQDSILGDRVKPGDKIILVCDVISTGYMTGLIEKRLHELNAELTYIAVLVDALDETFGRRDTYDLIKSKLISVVSHKMKKYKRTEISDYLKKEESKIIRINPYTNTPVTNTISDNPFGKQILISNEKFIELIGERHIKAGYYKFNNLIHPYFFDMEKILLEQGTGVAIVKTLFGQLLNLTTTNFEIIFYPKGSAVQHLNFNLLLTEILKNHNISVYELDRFQTNEGWRFPHPPTSLIEVAAGKSALIIDDGSCSGDSLMQMIDEVASLNVKTIDVLSIIGRLNDHKKDFFSRLRTIHNNNMEIPLNVFFGVHWHIPTYYVEESPIIRERNWLESIISLPNVPTQIRQTAKNVLGELSLKETKDPSNKYLLKRRDDSSVIEELILIKEELGKVASYRYYKEYFSFFDNFIRQYEGSEIQERYKKIESICAAFLHEPNLYQTIKPILPDLVEKIEVFVQTIFFGNPERKGRPRLRKDDLHYKWSNKNLIHLFFIVFKNDALKNILTIENSVTLFKDFTETFSDQFYLFYRILKYLPINRSQVNKRPYASHLIYHLSVLKDSAQLSNDQRLSLKRFMHFVSSLPIQSDGFIADLAHLRGEFGRIIDDQFHNEFIFNDKQVVNSQLRVIRKFNTEGTSIDENVLVVRKHWEPISMFVSNLLQFYAKYPEYFLFDDYLEDQGPDKHSLASLVGFVDNSIFDGNFGACEQLIKMIDEIFDRFILDNSPTYKLFSQTVVEEIEQEFEVFIQNAKREYPHLDIKILEPAPKASLNIPLYYLKEVCFKEIKSNLRHVNSGEPILVTWLDQENYTVLSIENSIGVSIETKGGKGLSKLKQLNSLPLGIEFNNYPESDKFIQTIKFSKI